MIPLTKKKILFILVMEENLPPQNFSLKNLRGSAKIDVVARTILSILPNYTNDIDLELHVIFAKTEPYLLTILDLPKRATHYDELEIAAMIRQPLNDFYDNGKLSATGDQISWQKLNNLTDYFKHIIVENYSLYYLHEQGTDFEHFSEKFATEESSCFILGGRHDISEEHEQLVLALNALKISLGKHSYLASTCTTFILFEIGKLITNKQIRK
ncbi:MAG: hypothetical protein ACTSQB_03035 [Candidatus Heimdallarchaeota archaeon]